MISKQLNGNQIILGTSSDGAFGEAPNNVNVPGVLYTDTIPNAIDKLIGILDLLAPAKSPRLSTKFLNFNGSGQKYEARHVGVGGGQSANVIYTSETATASAMTSSLYSHIVFNSLPTVRVTDSSSSTNFATFSDGREGILASYVDNIQKGFRTLEGTYYAPGAGGSPDIGGWDDTGSNGVNSLFITFDEDPFTVPPNTGFWTSLKATMSATQSFSDTDGIEHVYQMRHTKTGNTPQFHFICDTGDFDYTTTIPLSGNPKFEIGPITTTRWVSGVPGLTVGDYIIGSYTFSNAPIGGRYPLISRFYNKTQITEFFISDGSTTPSKKDLDSTTGYPIIGGLSSVPYAFKPEWGVLGLSVSVVTNMFTPSPTYDLGFFVRAYNPKGDSSPTTLYNYANYGGGINDKIYVDTKSNEGTVSGSTRVRSGNTEFPSFGGGPDQFGEDYAPGYVDKSIKGDVRTVASELMLQGGIYRYPTGNYTSNKPTPGFNYNTLDSSFNTPVGWRWATFRVGSITNASSIVINIAGGLNINKDGSNPVSNSMYLYVTVVNGGTQVINWIDANKSFGFPVVASPSNNGDGAVNMSLTPNGVQRTITFGETPRTGDVYVRIGLPNGTNKQFTNITKT